MSEDSRFGFGKNWAAFLSSIDENKIQIAINSLKSALKIENLNGKKVLDIGSGSGLFSLAASRLGAEVVSIDFDIDSVACTQHLKTTFGAENSNWKIMQGSVLDEEFMSSLGKFDGVYSWGVLHHTGEMDNAIRIARQSVIKGGWFFISIYNDQGGASRRWLAVKALYNKLPKIVRPVYVFIIAAWNETIFAIKNLLQLRNPFRKKNKESDYRGMSIWYDWVDWVGGFPFEVATPERIIIPLHEEGFVLSHLTTHTNGWGCNEYIFQLVGGVNK